ncbi:non-ribosomal peptide synthetase [Brevibacillus dissolubilis]|uniref:non-ribosomal peptide synthetase n=1 Tax=Brevibacillus dissolubilis TaxID=1844116 RepID=UPI0011174A59|nr:non-ribosomal peptide synthetase [Brevibacillus dissolubilis]
MKILFLSTFLDRNNAVVQYLESLNYRVDICRDKLQATSEELLDVDYIVSYAYGYILGSDIVSQFKGRIINLHPSMLPWNKGRDPVFWSVWDETPKGVTIHLIDESVDTGEILVQESISFADDETLLDCYQKANEAIEQLFIREWENIISGVIQPAKQESGGSFHYSRDRDFYQNLNLTTVKDLLRLKQIVQESTDKDYPREKTIHRLIEEQAERTPDATAVVYQDQSLTYSQLNEKANRLAHHLRAKGIGQGKIAAIMVDRSQDVIVGILAILKAGGAYVPIDSEYPQERISYILGDCGATVLLTQTPLINQAPFSGEIIDMWEESSYSESIENPAPVTTRDDLAYVIYTSGSTGLAKGVMIKHHNLVNFSCWHADYFDVTEADRTGVYSSFSFDGFLWDVFPYLIAGACLYIIPTEMRYDLEALNQYFEENGITINFFPTAVCEQFLLLQNNSLRVVIAGGDALKGWNEHSSYRLYNGYGPTECTIGTTTYHVDRSYVNTPIGKPIDNARVLILDEKLAIQPVGVEGELFILGEGVGYGYVNRPELTNEKFITNPYTGERMYRTGDIARWLPDGNVEYLGRIDNLVKIRGYRIEPGEVESFLIQHPKVKLGAVGVKEDENKHKYLVGYYVTDEELSPSELRVELAEGLPDYMMPRFFIQLDELPLTPNGKVDRRALPDVDAGLLAQQAQEYIAPTDELEEKIAAIWSAVLGVAQISVTDSFLECGGDSIKVIQLIHQMRANGFELTYEQLFTYPSIRKLKPVLQQQVTQNVRPITKALEQSSYEVSSVERRMYAIQLQDPESIAYNVTFQVELTSELTPEALEAALQQIVARHEGFRSTYHLADGRVVKKINTHSDFTLMREQTTTIGVPAILQKLVQPFDLAEGPLLRACLITTEHQSILWIDSHHIVLDGLSKSIFLRELQELLDQKELAPIDLTYTDFVYWQQEWEQSDDYQNQLTYWQNRLQDELPVTALPTKKRPLEMTYDGAVKTLILPAEVTKKIKDLAASHDVTLYMMLLTMVSTWLSKYSRDESQVVVGTVMDGRQHPDIFPVIGMFVNTLPMLVTVDDEGDLSTNLQQVKRIVLQALQNQYVPFEKIVEVSSARRENNRHPLFDVMFILQNTPGYGLEDRQQHINNGISKFDLTLEAEEKHNELHIMWEYNTNLFSEEMLIQLMKQFHHILKQMISGTGQPVKELRLITDGQQDELFQLVNDTARAYPTDRTVQQIFESLAETTPDRIALVCDNQTVTYRELNERANQLAHTLREFGVQPEDLVSILVERSVEMLVGIFGILKAGAAYLPIDPENPEDRIAYIVQDSQSKCLLTQNRHMAKVKVTVPVFDLNDSRTYAEETSNLPTVNQLNHLAYVIYTSGSTGKPKGVMIEHASLMNILHALQEEYPFLPDDAYLLKTTYTFDVSVAEIFGWVMGHGRLVILEPGAEKNPMQIWQTIVEHQVTHTNFVPSMLSPFVDYVERPERSRLRYIFAAGEAIPADLVQNVYQVLPDVKLENIYGPTESTIYATKYALPKGLVEHPVPIGKPLANIQMYILSKEDQMLPIGVLGELCIAGTSLARGYLNNQALTDEKFVPHPFEPGKKLYRTGDLARFREDGEIEYLGRIDHQVKIRGYRIELDEIRNQLIQEDSIRDAVVMARTDQNGQAYLCGYLLSDREWTVGELRELLRKELPDYMIPAHFVQMEQFPLTSSGKIDRKALPEPNDSVQRGVEYFAPRTKTEEQVAQIWADVLGLEKVGILDNFFELGGDSIKGLQIMSRLHKLHLQMLVKDLFKYPTISQLVPHLVSSQLTIDQQAVTGEVLLTPIQRYFFDRVKTDAHHWNQAMMIYRKEGFDLTLVKQTMEKIVEHHDALRMVYRVNENEVVQINRGLKEGELYSCQVYDLTHSDILDAARQIEEEATRVQAGISLDEGPLVKVALFQTQDGDHLLIAIHHLVVDGVSWRILFEDFGTGYQQAAEGKPILFQEKTHSFQTWAQELQQYANSKKMQQELDYWKNIEAIPTEPLPTDQTAASNLEKDTRTATVQLTAEETQNLLRHAHQAYQTEINDLLLVALGLTFKEWTGSSTVKVFMEGHGREDVIKGISIARTIGWFTSLFPVALDMASGQPLSDQIKQVKETIRAIPHKGIGYSILKYLSSQEWTGDFAGQPKPEIVFNYLGQFDTDLNTELFSRSELSTGAVFGSNCERMHKLDMYAMTVGGQLTIHVNYNSHEYAEQTMNQLLNRFAAHLAAVTAHCMGKESAELTPSDMSDKELTMEEMDDIFDLIGDL